MTILSMNVNIYIIIIIYGNWGKEARDTFSRLATRLAIGSPKSKSGCVYEIYSRLNRTLNMQIYCESNNGPDSRILIHFICRCILHAHVLLLFYSFKFIL